MHKTFILYLALISLFAGSIQTAHALPRRAWVWIDGAEDFSCEPSEAYPSGYSLTKGAGRFAPVAPGKTYQFGVGIHGSSPNLDTEGNLVFHYEPFTIKIEAPSGYTVYIDGKRESTYSNLYNDSMRTEKYRVAGPEESSLGRPGTATSLRPGDLFWQISMGRDRNGNPFVPVTLSADLTTATDWSDVWTTKSLFRIQDGQENGQEVAAIVNTINETSYEISLFTRFEPATLPFVKYVVAKGASATSLTITRTSYQKTAAADTNARATLIEQTSIEKSGIWPNCSWVVKDWNVVGQPQQVEKTMVSSGTDQRFTESYSIRDSSGISAKSEARTYQKFWWGFSEVIRTVGTINPETTTTEYYTTGTITPEQVKSRTFSGGGWEAFTYTERATLYTNTGAAKVKQYQKPFNNFPAAAPTDPSTNTDGDITTYSYTTTVLYGSLGEDVSFPWDIQKRERRINGVLVEKRELEESRTSSSVAVRKYKSSNTSVDSVSEVEGRYLDAQDRIRIKMLGSGEASWSFDLEPYYGYMFPGPGQDRNRRMVTIKGSSQSDDGCEIRSAVGVDLLSAFSWMLGDPGYGNYWAALQPAKCYLVPNKSTAHVELYSVIGTYVTFESADRLFRTEDYLWTGSAWVLIGWEDLTYDPSCNVVRRVNAKGEVWEAEYIGHLKQWEIGTDGKRLDYTYDPAGRVQTVTQAAAGPIPSVTTTYTYNALGQVLTERVGPSSAENLLTTREYDDAGRPTKEQVGALNPTLINYNPTARQTTTILPSGAIITETRNLDGSLASQTGTATVPAFYTYGVEPEPDGRRWTRVDVGTANSVRWSKAWTDWLGRTVRTERPGAPGFGNIVGENFYENITGRRVASTSTGLAPTRYVYGAMGQLVRSGIDINLNGQLDLGSADRITESDSYFENYDNAWWLTQTSTTYPYLNSATAKTLARTRQRVTGFGGSLRAEVRTLDADGNESVQTTDIDRASATVIVSTDRPGMANVQTDTLRNGMPVSSTGHDGRTSSIGYDALLRISSTRDPRHTASSRITYYTGSNLTKEVIDAAGKYLSTTSYDLAGRPSVVFDADSKTTRYAYNDRSQIEYQWGSAAHPVSFVYNAYGQLWKQRTYRDGAGTIAWNSATWPGASATADETEWLFDEPSGLLLRKYDPSRRYVEQTYNARGQTYQRFWNRVTNPYDGSNLRVTTTYAYDDRTGEPTSISYNDGTPTVGYAYTRTGQVDTVTDATGQRDFVYDSTRPWRLANETLSGFYGSRVINNVYDETTTTNNGETSYNGHTISSVTGRPRAFTVQNPAQAGAGVELETSWAASNTGRIAGAFAGSHYGAGARRFVYGYEPNSNFLKTLSVVDNAFFVTRDYEPNRDLLASIQTSWATATPVSVSRFAYTYDDRGNRLTVAQSGSAYSDYGDAIHRKLVYNDRSELTTDAAFLGTNPDSEANPLAARRHEYDYDAIGNRKSSNTSGVVGLRDHYVTNERNQYTTRENNTLSVGGTADASATVVAGSGTTTASSRAGAHWGDNILVDNNGKPFYGPLTFYAARSSNGSATNDLLGTIIKTGFLPPVAQTFSYDLDGNLTSDGVWDYQWDAENRLVRASTTTLAAAAGMPNRELSFVYDYLGRRVEKRVYNKDNYTQISSRRYLYNGWNVIAEIENNLVIRSYTWGLDIVGSLSGAGGVGALLQIFDHRTDKAYFPGYDGNGNVSVLIDAASGAIAAAYEYSPYGETLRCEGTYAKENVYRFSTKETDDETGLSYYGRRYYDPHNGRFINRDPIEESGGLNLYGFVGNNPANKWDFLGMDTTPEERWKVTMQDGVYVAKDSEGTIRMSYDPSGTGNVYQFDANGKDAGYSDIGSYMGWNFDSASDRMSYVSGRPISSSTSEESHPIDLGVERREIGNATPVSGHIGMVTMPKGWVVNNDWWYSVSSSLETLVSRPGFWDNVSRQDMEAAYGSAWDREQEMIARQRGPQCPDLSYLSRGATLINNTVLTGLAITGGAAAFGAPLWIASADAISAAKIAVPGVSSEVAAMSRALYVTGIVAAGSPTGQKVMNNVLEFVDGAWGAPGSVPSRTWAGIGGAYYDLGDKAFEKVNP